MSWSYNSTTGQITMTKGDTPTFEVTCNIVEQSTGKLVPYVPVEDDEFIFAVRQDRNSGSALFTETVDKDTMTVTLKESDTKDLEVGKYYYEISLNNGDYHCTFIHDLVLKLTPEIY